MVAPGDEDATRADGVWQREVLARHRWGRHGGAAKEELARLRKLRGAAGPLGRSYERIVEQIVALEICNWNLEESILALCGAIGAREPAELAIGHLASVADERWKKVWAYYLALRNWLPSEGKSGYRALLRTCDPGGAIEGHVRSLLGERDELKELYVERLCLNLAFWLGGFFPADSPQREAYRAATAALETKIRERDPEAKDLDVFDVEGAGGWGPCHHKAFRRFDIIISSVGAGKWRAVMPRRGTDGFERAALLDEYLVPIERWVDGAGEETPEANLAGRIHDLLGERDNVKIFLASLLASLLRAQQLFARNLAESRAKEA
jgi:hypothetical protein